MMRSENAAVVGGLLWSEVGGEHTIGTCDVWRMWRTRSMTPASVVPDLRARSDARWMVGPSASGSLKGTPSSITSAPASASASTNFSVASSDGSPAVMYATMPSTPELRSSANRLEIRVELEGAAIMDFCEG